MLPDSPFAAMFSHGPVACCVTGEAWLQAMLDVEAGHARACARVGIIPQGAADQIVAACSAGQLDAGAIGREAAWSANPVVPLVAALRRQVGGAAAQHVHHGATSQDIVDSAAMLVARRALEPMLGDARSAAERCAHLARSHRDTPQMGRTLLQHAVPITFGAKAATWLVALDSARGRLAEVGRTTLAVQLGGAAGTMAGFDGRGYEVMHELALELGLSEPVIPWHADRLRPATLASALASLAGVGGKLARDVTLMAQSEVAEARERPTEGRGGSSTMPHKQNPVAAVSTVACAARAPGLVATMNAMMIGEHERAAGAWQAEWETLSDLLRVTGSAVAWTREVLEVLEVDAGRMLVNLGDVGADTLAAHVAAAGTIVDRALEAHTP